MIVLRNMAISCSSVVVLAACAILVCVRAAEPQEVGLRDLLWVIVDGECVPNELHNHDPKPCLEVDLDDGIEKGFAVLKDIGSKAQVLLIPTARVPGIESPSVLAPDAPNYFADAWEARRYIDEALHRTLPRDEIGLAINSAPSRSQDQLHIHVDCIRSDLRDLLRARETLIGSRWVPLSFLGHPYEVIWVPGDRLGSTNPFRLLAEKLHGEVKDMGDRTLVVVGSSRAGGTKGFVIFEGEVNREIHDLAHGEELLDHSCSIASDAPLKN
jgi:CDP-diacylglycerol pyrophosphatase